MVFDEAQSYLKIVLLLLKLKYNIGTILRRR